MKVHVSSLIFWLFNHITYLELYTNIQYTVPIQKNQSTDFVTYVVSLVFTLILDLEIRDN